MACPVLNDPIIGVFVGPVAMGEKQQWKSIVTVIFRVIKIQFQFSMCGSDCQVGFFDDLIRTFGDLVKLRLFGGAAGQRLCSWQRMIFAATGRYQQRKKYCQEIFKAIVFFRHPFDGSVVLVRVTR